MSEQDSGDWAGVCPKCQSNETWVSYEDPSANHCGACSTYWRPTAPASSESPRVRGPKSTEGA